VGLRSLLGTMRALVAARRQQGRVLLAQNCGIATQAQTAGGSVFSVRAACVRPSCGIGRKLQLACSEPAALKRGAASAAAPATSALEVSTRKLRDAFYGAEAVAEIVTEVDQPVDVAAALERIKAELKEGEDELKVLLLGEELVAGPGRRSLAVKAPMGPSGGSPVRTIKMHLPSVADMTRSIEQRKADNPRVQKPEELADILEKFLSEKYLGRRSEYIAQVAAWGPKVLGDAEGEFAEIGALIALSLRAYRGALKASREDYQFEVQRTGDGKDCLVMPPSNFALLGVKDMVHILLHGYRVLCVVQPRFVPLYLEIQKDLTECGLPAGMLEVLPGISPDADPGVLEEALRLVDRLQFTGSSAMFKNLVAKAFSLGNLRLEYAGEISGLNKVRLDGVSVTHPAAAAGTSWAAMANNGELCTSASLLEFDPKTGDTAELAKASLESHGFKLGRDPTDTGMNVLLKDGKTDGLEVKTEAAELTEWWEKTILAAPVGGKLSPSTNKSLGHCIYAPTIERALAAGVREDASCIYCVGVSEDKGAVHARAGTTGCKVPESVFGGMKSYTSAVGGDHDGVGSIQTVLSTVKRRGVNWRDQEEAYAQYELTETAEMLLEFLNPRDHAAFHKQISNVLEVFKGFEPEVSKPYDGQPLVGAEGRSQLVTLKALRPLRKQLLVPRGVELPEDVVKVAALHAMSPLRELPVDLHVVRGDEAGKLRVTDPLKSFLRVVEKQLGWRLHVHKDIEGLTSALQAADYPPYFIGIKDRHLLPLELLLVVAEQGGYLYEGLPADALSLFRLLTTTQAWTVACTEAQVAEATAELQKQWKTVALRDEPHEPPEIVKPRPRDVDIGGGFGDTGVDLDDKDWADIDSADESSDDDDAPPPKKADGSGGTAPANNTGSSSDATTGGSKAAAGSSSSSSGVGTAA